MRRLAGGTIAVAAALALYGAPAVAGSHKPAPSPSPTPVADPAITAAAKKQFVAWQAGNVNKTLYEDAVQTQLADDKVQQTSLQLGKLGALTGTVYMGPLAVDSSEIAGGHGYIYRMNCIGGSVYQFMILDGQGKIARIFFKDQLTTETVTAAPSATP